MNHRDQWRFIQADFPVNGDLVEYDFFPRGRVIVCPTFDDENRIIGYECNVYADSCIIDDPIVRMEIEDAFDLDLLDVAYRTEIRDWKKNAEAAKKKQDETYENRAELLEEYRAKRLKEERPGKEVQSTVVIIGAMVFLLLIMACCCGVGSMYGEEILEFLEKYYSDLYHLIFP